MVNIVHLIFFQVKKFETFFFKENRQFVAKQTTKLQKASKDIVKTEGITRESKNLLVSNNEDEEEDE